MQSSLGNRLSNTISLATGAAGVSWSGPEYHWIFEWIFYISILWAVVSISREGWSNRAKLVEWLGKVEPIHLQIFGLVGVIVFSAVALGGVVWQWRRPALQIASTAHAAQPSTQAAVEPIRTPAPYYSKADIDNLLDATREISALLQTALPIRDNALSFDRTWNEIILSQSNEAARLKLKEVRVGLQSIADQGWAISNKYSHYNDQIGPILGGMNFSERASNQIQRFNQAIEKLRPDADRGTVSLLEPVRADYQEGINLFQKWLSDTLDKNSAATERFRNMQHAVSNSAQAKNGLQQQTTEFVKNIKLAYEDDKDGRQLYLFGEAAVHFSGLQVVFTYSARTPFYGWENPTTKRITAIPDSVKGEPIKVSLMPKGTKAEENWYRLRYSGKIIGEYAGPIRVKMTIVSADGREQSPYYFLTFSNDPTLLLTGSELDFAKPWDEGAK